MKVRDYEQTRNRAAVHDERNRRSRLHDRAFHGGRRAPGLADLSRAADQADGDSVIA